RALTLGIDFPKTEGRLIYDASTDTTPFESWTFHCSVGVSALRIRLRQRPTDSLPTLDLEAFRAESVGANKSVRILRGRVEFEYQVVAGCAGNVFFCMIPMQETSVGRTGLIEVGTEIQAHPANAKSKHRIRSVIPAERYGDGIWHRGEMEFDFRGTPTAFY